MGFLKLTLIGLIYFAGNLRGEDPPEMNLTSYEMFTTVDLLIEIAVRPCKGVSRPVMSSIKQFVYQALQNAPKKTDRGSHGRFLESYVNLVNCLSFVDANYEKILKNLGDPYNMPENKNGKQRVRREAEEKSEDQIYLNTVNNRRNSAEHDEVDMVEYEKSFDLFFYFLFSITQRVCPLTREAFSLDFIVPVLDQTVNWITKDTKIHKGALQKYFHNGEVINELRLCDAAVIIEKKFEDFGGNNQDDVMDEDD